MNQYYLMSQLPSLDSAGEGAPLPITVERLHELCADCLGEKAMNVLENLSLAPGRSVEPAGYALADAWNENESQLRLALGSIRAAKMKKNFDIGPVILPAQLLQAARTAADMDPLAAEKFLNRFRLDFLEEIRPLDHFCEDAVFYYWLKLKLLQRMRQFDEDKGRTAYRNIYGSIMRGDEQEAE